MKLQQTSRPVSACFPKNTRQQQVMYHSCDINQDNSSVVSSFQNYNTNALARNV